MRRYLPVAIVWLTFAHTAFALDITACGTFVPESETGVLQSDLVCGGLVAVTLGRDATLDLNGYSLTVTDQDVRAVYCSSRRCTVSSTATSPGTLHGSTNASYGVHGAGTFNLNADDETVKRVVVDNVVFRDFAFAGIYARQAKAVVSRASFFDCYAGLLAAKLELQAISTSGGAYGIDASKLIRGTDVTVEDAWLIGVSGNQSRLDFTRLRVSGSGLHGVAASSVRLRESDLSTNGIADLKSERRPRLVDTTCERSVDLSGLAPWGVCSLD